MSEKQGKKKLNLRTIIIRLIAVIALPICLCVPINYLQHYLCIPVKTDQVRILQFEKEPDNTIDVIMLGSSPTYSGFSSAYAYGKYGFTSYPYAIGGASCTMWKPAMINVLRTQKPKLVVVDVFGGGYDIETVKNRKASIYMIGNVMPLSPKKIKMASEASKNMDSGDTLSILFPIIRYHSDILTNSKEIKERLAVEEYGPSPMKGIELITNAKKQKLIAEEAFTNDTIPLDKQTETVIIDFIDYCRNNDINLLFVKYPCAPKNSLDYDANKRQNSVLKLVENNGCSTLNLQSHFHDIGLDVNTDFYNRGHTNVRGQKKITNFVASYLRDSMGITPSALDDPVKADWEKAAVYYDAYCGLSEEMISAGKIRFLSESPELVKAVEEYIHEHE